MALYAAVSSFRYVGNLIYTLQKSICYFDNCICHQSCNHRLQLFADSFRDHQVKRVSHTPATPLIMHLDYAEFTQTLIHVSGVGSVAAVAAMAATLFWPRKKNQSLLNVYNR